MSKLYMVKHPKLQDLVQYCQRYCPSLHCRVHKEMLLQIELDIIKVVNCDLMPCGGTPDETHMEFLEPWRFDKSASHIIATESMETFQDKVVFSNNDVEYTVSINTCREREIMHYWQARRRRASLLLS